MDRIATVLLQDLFLNLTYAKLKGHCPFYVYYNELKDNMLLMLKNKLPYTLIEKALSEYGYEIPDIRRAFFELTSIKPEKILFMKYQDLQETPPFVPQYNYGWGYDKKDKNVAYVIIGDDLSNGYKLCKAVGNPYYGIVEDIEYNISLSKLKESLYKKVDRVRSYDAPAWEDILNYKGELKYKSNDYDRFLEMIENKNIEKKQFVKSMYEQVKLCRLSYDEAIDLIKRVAEDTEKEEPEEKIKKEKEQEIETKDLSELQKEKVQDALKPSTPTDFFKENIPNREAINISNHIKTVVSYINNKSADFKDFDINIFKINYEFHKIPSTIVMSTTEAGLLEGNYKAAINVILEFVDKSTQIKKYGLMLFFVSTDGVLTTSDSFKGEDDIIYGFTENGIAQYFGK